VSSIVIANEGLATRRNLNIASTKGVLRSFFHAFDDLLVLKIARTGSSRAFLIDGIGGDLKA
jgi:hypothetical protein